MRIFVATVEAILRRTFPPEASIEQCKRSRPHGGMWSTTTNMAVAELRTMIHSLFLESCASMDLASRLLFVMLTVCVSHEALPNGSKRPTGGDEFTEEMQVINGKTASKSRIRKKQGPVATFDSYVLAAVCALACELQLFPLLSKNCKNLESRNSSKVAKTAKANGVSQELRNGIGPAVSHARRILGILEALFSLKPSSVGTSWSYSSNEIVAAAMVAAHVSQLFGRSKTCTNALSVLMRCKWDNEISTRASSLYHLIDVHGKTVASILNMAEPLQANLVCAHVRKGDLVSFGSAKHAGSSSNSSTGPGSTSSLESDSSAKTLLKRDTRAALLDKAVINPSGKRPEKMPMDASDLANFLTMDRNIGFNCSAQALVRSVFDEKQELCFSVVSLLWHKLIASPETQMSAESTSAQQGWRQVMDALCDVVTASPTKASTAIVLQAERDLQPWIARDDEQGQKMWRINQRIVKLIVELLRNHDNPEVLIVLASASDLLLRATDGMLVDGEACTLPQLELLEVTAGAVQRVADWGESGLAVADSLSDLLKCRLSATVRCLSHPSAHVRALSSSVLRDLMHSSPIKSGERKNNGPLYRCSSVGTINWHADIEKCIRWEARSRHATDLTLVFLNAAAKELGCPLPR